MARYATGTRNGVTQQAYADHIGRTVTSVSLAKRHGKLVLYPDGSINQEESDKLRAGTIDPLMANAPVGPAPQNGAAKKLEAIPVEKIEALSETLRASGYDAPAVTGNMTLIEARTAHEILKAHERKVKLDQLTAESVDRVKAKDLVFRLARQERDALIGWPSRIAAVMAAELGVDPHAMQTTLEKFVREYLGDLSDVKIEFR